jgi:molecular chaperone GrpE (heat shock protein)
MTERCVPKISRAPFIAADAVLLGVAAILYFNSAAPLSAGVIAAIIACAGLGAVLCVLPWLLEFKAAAGLAETENLISTLDQIRDLEKVGARIAGATQDLETVKEQSARTVATADEIARRIGEEARAFAESMQKANDAERAHLRLEVEKLRRAENDWLQVLVRILDHVFALHQAALRSGQPNLAEQIGQFQNACRDAARRIGLVPFAAGPADPFDASVHQLVEGNGGPEEGAISDIIAAGYTFQGQLLRKALVVLANGEPSATPVEQQQAAEENAEPAPEPAAIAEPAPAAPEARATKSRKPAEDPSLF